MLCAMVLKICWKIMGKYIDKECKRIQDINKFVLKGKSYGYKGFIGNL
jgi:hypothetical protein